MFAIGDKKWPGISKLTEELSEVGQVIGKLMGSRGKIEHWSGNLLDMLHDELGDVVGAINFVVDHCELSREKIQARANLKYAQFVKWHKEDPEP